MEEYSDISQIRFEKSIYAKKAISDICQHLREHGQISIWEILNLIYSKYGERINLETVILLNNTDKDWGYTDGCWKYF